MRWDAAGARRRGSGPAAPGTPAEGSRAAGSVRSRRERGGGRLGRLCARRLRPNLVVPLGQFLGGEQGERGHLLVADPCALGILLGDARGGDLESGLGRRRPDVLQDGLEAVEGAAGPVEAEEAEQAMFNRIPLAAAGGEMRDRDPQAVGIAEGVLERVFPGAGCPLPTSRLEGVVDAT